MRSLREGPVTDALTKRDSAFGDYREGSTSAGR
jgi:hypothetical protein